MSKLGDPDWKPPLEKPYITEERMTPTPTDPVSDEACLQWYKEHGDRKSWHYVLPAWQECRRREKGDMIDAWNALSADNKRLRGLLERHKDLLDAAISSLEEYKALRRANDEVISVSRAALEGE